MLAWKTITDGVTVKTSKSRENYLKTRIQNITQCHVSPYLNNISRCKRSVILAAFALTGITVSEIRSGFNPSRLHLRPSPRPANWLENRVPFSKRRKRSYSFQETHWRLLTPTPAHLTSNWSTIIINVDSPQFCITHSRQKEPHRRVYYHHCFLLFITEWQLHKNPQKKKMGSWYASQ